MPASWLSGKLQSRAGVCKPLMPHCPASLMVNFSVQTCDTGQIVSSTPNKQNSCLGEATVMETVKLQKSWHWEG